MYKDIAEAIEAVSFSVYGIVGEPLNLIHDGLFTFSGFYPTVGLSYTSMRYPVYSASHHPVRTFRIISADARHEVVDVRDHYLEKMIEEQVQPVRNPFCWAGTITIAETLFNGTMTYYASPLRISGFRLTSEQTLFWGHAYGPSCDELTELLEGLQVINAQ